MKHSMQQCKTKLRAIYRLAEQIKSGIKEETVEEQVIVMLAEQIQQDSLLLEKESES